MPKKNQITKLDIARWIAIFPLTIIAILLYIKIIIDSLYRFLPSFFDIKVTNFMNADKFCPCLTCQTGAFWCIPLHRMMNIKEYKALQGFQVFNEVVSNSQLKRQLGNSMSVNVVKVIISNLLKHK